MSIQERMVKKASLLSFIIFLCSCAEVRTLTPASRFISPESGEDSGHGNVQMFYAMGTEATLNATSSEFNKPMDLNEGARFSLGADVNIYKKASLIYYSNGMDSAPLFGVKYQLMGPTKSQAKKGDQSLSITLGGGASGETRQDENAVFDDSDFDEVNIERNLVDFSVIYGKRIDDRVLWYSSLQINQHKLHVGIKDDSSALDGESVDFQTTNLGASTGLMMYDKDGRYHFALEASFQKTKWTKNDETQRGFINGAVGFNW